MPQPILLADAAHIVLPEAKMVAEPIGTPTSAAATLAVEAPDKLLTGVWECSPGKWRRQVLAREFSHIIAGRCSFIPDDGEPIELKAGDAVLFPENCRGVWDIKETIRKSFVIIP